MGGQLADDILQGLAGADEFRTAPVWGVGQELFFLHDGRAQTLEEANETHASCAPGVHNSGGMRVSEADAVIHNHHALTAQNKGDLLNFLGGL